MGRDHNGAYVEHHWGGDYWSDYERVWTRPEEPEEEPGDIWFDYLSVEFEVYGEGVSKYTNISSGNLFWGGELYASNTGFSYLSGYAVTEVSSYVVAEAENTTAIVVDLITTVEIS